MESPKRRFIGHKKTPTCNFGTQFARTGQAVEIKQSPERERKRKRNPPSVSEAHSKLISIIFTMHNINAGLYYIICGLVVCARNPEFQIRLPWVT